MPTAYIAPPMTDLAEPRWKNEEPREADHEYALKLEELLAGFQIRAHVTRTLHGPVFTVYEFKTADPVDESRLSLLKDNLKKALSVPLVMTEAPDSDPDLLRIYVMNGRKENVPLRDVLESEQMLSAGSLLTVPLGLDAALVPVVCDLAKMPDLLIYGRAGSGKSTLLHSMIISFLYRAGPDEVQMILMDYRASEFLCYNGIPHLWTPVVTGLDRAAEVLADAVEELESRLNEFEKAGARNLSDYNKQCVSTGRKPLPRIVFVIDELSILFWNRKEKTEDRMIRLIYLGWAAGIHLIASAQGSMIEIWTNGISKRFPGKVVFKTGSIQDSMAMCPGIETESLSIPGEMLYLPYRCRKPQRIQGCNISREEIVRVVKHVKEANPGTQNGPAPD